MNPVDLITKKRDGGEHTPEELHFLVQGMVDGSIPDYQLAAWAMAVYFQGMSDAEATQLTLAMANSGDTLDLRGALATGALAPGALIVDKHSSGGVGDKTTLAVGPIVAACGLPVGKMSGRGLSFSGGTIDKLESISGWSPDLSEERFRQQLQEIGLVIAGQTADLAPADKHLYALRDVTGTVPSLPLIAASIMSKKLAAGADAIVLDVKCGRGAFMENLDDARALARLMVAIGDGAGRKVTALITGMEQPLGNAVGNALEVQEAIETLHGRGPTDFQELVERVCAEMVLLGDPACGDLGAAQKRVREAIASGAALEKLVAFVAAQGGNPDEIRHPERLPRAPIARSLLAETAGFVHAIDAREIGLTVVELGGGRKRKGDAIDFGVGVVCQTKVGDRTTAGGALCTVYAADEASASIAVSRLRGAWRIADGPTAPLPVILDRITGD
ncbi:MAG: thymidine phosphorylase [Caldilineaceae bacterium]|nr:thymidine phosphorylase [Caldilineaceae bacterium]